MELRKLFQVALFLAICHSAVWVRCAEPEDKEEESKEEEGSSKESEKKTDKKKKKDDPFKPYDEVITEEVTTDAGLFWVHRGDDKVYFEIPREEFGGPFLWITQMAQTQAGFGFAGAPVGNLVVRWELKEDSVWLREVHYSIRAEAEDPIRTAVQATSLEPILAQFPILAWGKDRAPVIDVTSLYTNDRPEWSAKRSLNAAGADKDRTFVEAVKSFPDNIEAKIYVTYRMRDDRGVVTVMLHHSMIRLPNAPMRPRIQDARVGYFSVSFEDYGTEAHQVEELRYITRWRLEKKDPDAELSEPKEPIVFYVGRGVPQKWRSWVRKGIEAWQPAFEKAGFKKAIIAKEPPDPREDPDWDAEDARYSVVRWLPSTIENAYGPHVHDPRSGEIIEADIRMYHNVLKLVRDWYFVQASPMDERAQKLPMPDELMGELLAYVVSHEVGHSLGLQHNMKASSAYTVEQLRDPEFTAKNGTEASIMDYGRFNYVAQPGDGARLIPVVAPYDHFAIEWGYREFPNLSSKEEDEKLEEIVERQVDEPMLRFGSANPSVDPSAQTEDLGADPIEATRLGLLNIDRVATNLVSATSKKGEDYSLLRNMYDRLVGQRDRELNHVVAVVGGMVMDNLWFGQADTRFTPVAADRQRAAVRFLNERAFETPKALVDRDILLRLEASGAADRLLNSQRSILNSLLRESRVNRMAELATRAEGEAYLAVDLLEDLREGIWSETEKEDIRIDLFRRNLQRAYTELLVRYLDEDRQLSEMSTLARAELKELSARLAKASGKTDDKITRYHLEDLQARIEAALEGPKDGE